MSPANTGLATQSMQVVWHFADLCSTQIRSPRDLPANGASPRTRPISTTPTTAQHFAYLPWMGVGSGGPPGIPGPNLTDIGQGRFARFRRVAILERHDGTAWTVVSRYGSIRDADVALDDAVGAGADPSSMRVVETHTSAATSRALAVAGFLALGVAIAIIVLYVLLG